MKILFNIESLPHNINELDKLYVELNCHPITDVDLWDQLKCYENPPHFGNVYCYVLFSDMKNVIESRYGFHVDWFINGTDTHFYINRQKISTCQDFFDLMD